MAAPGDGQDFELTLHADRLGQPLGRNKPTVYFVGSMADLFHAAVPDTFIDRVLAVAHRTPWHTDLLLTPRAERLADFFASRTIPPNIWLGVTVEDRRHGLPRIDFLRWMPARVRCFKPWGTAVRSAPGSNRQWLKDTLGDRVRCS